MNKTLPRFFICTLLALALFPSPGQAEEEKEFLEFYYESPRPDDFVAQMKDWADDGTLENVHARPALIAFISQVIRANRDRLNDWFVALSGLTPEQKQVFYTAMLYSRTAEADTLMRETFGQKYDQQKVDTEKILEMDLDKENTLDMLWGFFYATGSENAIRRIVACFRYAEAPDNPEGLDIPQGYVPLYRELPGFANGSLVANGRRHPRLVEILETMLESDASLNRFEKEGLYDVLSELKPDKYPYRDRSGRSA